LENVTKRIHNLNLELWDTAGNEKFRAIMEIQLKMADIVFLVFDINSPSSLNILEEYYKKIQNYLKNETVVCLLGNKADIQKDSFDIDFNKNIYNFVKVNSFYYGETSIFFDSYTIYKELVFFNQELINEKSFRDFFSQDESQGISFRNADIKKSKQAGYIIYNQIDSFKKDQHSEISKKSPLFENSIFLNAGIMVILENVINEVRVRKNIEIKNFRRQDSGGIKLSSGRVST
jgi:GTPase SAR1 family protein